MRSIKRKTWMNILQFPYSPHSSLYFSFGIGKENLFNNQELLWLVIISPILMPLLFDCGMILWGEIRCSSLLGVKGFIEKGIIMYTNFLATVLLQYGLSQ